MTKLTVIPTTAKGNSKFHFDWISLNTVLFDFNVEPNSIGLLAIKNFQLGFVEKLKVTKIFRFDFMNVNSKYFTFYLNPFQERVSETFDSQINVRRLRRYTTTRNRLQFQRPRLFPTYCRFYTDGM